MSANYHCHNQNQRSAKRKGIAANVYGDTGVTDEPPSPTTPGAN